MGFSKGQLLERLQVQQIEFSQYEHPVVMTVEAQAKYVGHIKGGLSKNLFLKDKKHRFYIVSALADTKVDLKVLSQRLGLGKGGLRMAPEEAVAEILQVPLGCVTPFALVNESARHVSLLLDQGFKTQECCFFHPLANDTTISLRIQDLDMFLKSIGRMVAYVDLEANPLVGKDQPPDLATLVPSDTVSITDVLEKTASLQIDGGVNSKPTSVTAKASKVSSGPQKDKLVNTANSSHSFADPEKFVEEILEKASAIVLSEIKEENIKQHGEQLGAVVSSQIRKNLSLELKNLAVPGLSEPLAFLVRLSFLVRVCPVQIGAGFSFVGTPPPDIFFLFSNCRRQCLRIRRTQKVLVLVLAAQQSVHKRSFFWMNLER